jgi:hypothetical protein
MADKWERTYNEIAADAGEQARATLPWPRLFGVLRSKFEPIVALDNVALERLRTRMANRIAEERILYLFDTALCSFCLRAELETRSTEHSQGSRACQACILGGKCFDPRWLVRPIHMAISRGNFDDFRALVRQGLDDIAEILKKAEGDDPKPT